MARLLLAAGLIGAAFGQEETAAAPSFLFLEEFTSGLGPFAKSDSSKYAGQPVSVKDGSILFKDANKHYGVSAPLKTVTTKDDSFVFQYEVRGPVRPLPTASRPTPVLPNPSG